MDAVVYGKVACSSETNDREKAKPIAEAEAQIKDLPGN